VSKTLPSDFPNIEISRVRTGRPIRAEDWQTYPPAHNWLWAKSGALWPGIVWDPAFLDTNGNTTNDDTSDGGSPGSANLVFNELIKPYRVLASGNYEFEVSAFLVVLGFLDGWQALMWAVYSGVIHKWIKSGSVGPATIGGNDDDQD
jgi:hypothetical protein